MLINNVQNNNVKYSKPNFQGTVKNTHLFKNYAMEYAKNIRVYDEDWNKLKMFINTIRAIKNDGTTNEFVIDTIGNSTNRLWFIKYGNYLKQSEFFKSNIYSGKSYGYEKLEEDVFTKIVQFGKEYFGIAKVSTPIDDFKPAKQFLKRAKSLRSKSLEPRNRNVAERLIRKAQKEEKRADEAIAQIRTNILYNL